MTVDKGWTLLDQCEHKELARNKGRTSNLSLRTTYEIYEWETDDVSVSFKSQKYVFTL